LNFVRVLKSTKYPYLALQKVRHKRSKITRLTWIINVISNLFPLEVRNRLGQCNPQRTCPVSYKMSLPSFLVYITSPSVTPVSCIRAMEMRSPCCNLLDISNVAIHLPRSPSPYTMYENAKNLKQMPSSPRR
jgi:hypothetical protein